MIERSKDWFLKEGTPLPLGVSKTAAGIQFAVAFQHAEKCKLAIYHRGEKKPCQVFSFDEQNHHRVGDVFYGVVCGLHVEQLINGEYEYLYIVDGVEKLDPYANAISGREIWGERQQPLRAKLQVSGYEWSEDARPSLTYPEMVLYQLHVRGFTKHRSSGVKHKGTFRGVMEKLPYIQELGVNALLLLPCYEFEEQIQQKEPSLSAFMEKKYRAAMEKNTSVTTKNTQQEEGQHPQINYWGYTKKASYFAPKASYCAKPERACDEMKDMIQACHKAGIEVLMDFYFAAGTDSGFILNCLRYWVIHYRVDGFRINQDVVSETLVSNDPVLSRTKLLATHWAVPNGQGNLADCNDGFLVDARRYLKGDEGMVAPFAGRMKEQYNGVGIIHYLTNYNGFTLMDLVSYDVKHNEENGENNADGTQYNYSWNCGFEGETKRKTVMQSRMRQMKDGLLMLLLSQGTPMLLSGDEWANSQQGNNNAYCQDNELGWTIWKKGAFEKELYMFTKNLIAFRRQHPVFCQKRQLQGMDTIACGMPDISLHGVRAWCADFSVYNRILGVLFSGQYVKDDDFYVAMNMHWEPHEFSLPKARPGYGWKCCLSTSEIREVTVPLEDEAEARYIMRPRTISVFQSEALEEKRKTSAPKKVAKPSERKV